MKQTYTWKKTIGFLLVFCIVLCVFNLPFYSYKDAGYQYMNIGRKVRQIKNLRTDSIDVLFLGDSETWAAISPIQLFGEQGIASYNCASEGQWAGDSLILLKKTLQTQSPKVVVLGANTLYSYPNKYKYFFTTVLPIFHYHSCYKGMIKKANDAATLGANLSSSIKPYRGTEDYMESSKKEELNELSLKELNELNELTQAKNITLIMISSPSALNWTNGKHNAVQKWCDTNQVPYVDYNDEEILDQIGFDWSTDTRDGGDHVNLSGSKKVTSALGTYLMEEYELSNHKNDPQYTEWLQKYVDSQMYKKGKKS